MCDSFHNKGHTAHFLNNEARSEGEETTPVRRTSKGRVLITSAAKTVANKPLTCSNNVQPCMNSKSVVRVILDSGVIRHMYPNAALLVDLSKCTTTTV